MTLAATRDAAAPAIAIKGLELTFRNGGEVTPVLRGLDLTVRRGEFLAIVGSSGVGKSTLLRVLMNLAQPSAGTVRLTPDPEAERPLALVFQEARLLPWRRVLANVAFGLEKSSLPATARRERALAALHLVRLDHLAERWPYQLSGGQRQRVALARALAVRPSILLMDEPFSALDITTRETLQDEILQIHTETDKTILFVTHDIDEAVYLADRVIALGGKPGEIRSERIIDVLRPRRRDSRALADFVAQIRADLTADARAQDDWVI